MAKGMEKEERSLGATKKLDSLAPAIGDWHDLVSHGVYREGLLEAHARERSFWAKYGL